MIKTEFKFKNLLSILAVFTLLSVILLPTLKAEAFTAKTALVYGDSLAFEAQPAMLNQFALKKGWHVTARAIPGISLCQMNVGWLLNDLATIKPSVVSVETHGGTTGNCMLDSNGVAIVRDSTAYYDKYRADLNYLFANVTATGAKMVFIKTPPEATSAGKTEQDTLTNIAIQEAGKFHGVSISSVARTAVGGNVWKGTMTCLTTETAAMGCQAGKIIVRAPDKLHFCPVGYVDDADWQDGCNVYSSGANRYGKAMANTTATPPAPILP